jgi:hypothetical protein
MCGCRLPRHSPRRRRTPLRWRQDRSPEVAWKAVRRGPAGRGSPIRGSMAILRLGSTSLETRSASMPQSASRLPRFCVGAWSAGPKQQGDANKGKAAPRHAFVGDCTLTSFPVTHDRSLRNLDLCGAAAGRRPDGCSTAGNLLASCAVLRLMSRSECPEPPWLRVPCTFGDGARPAPSELHH